MLGMVSKRIGLLLYLVVITALWGGFAGAADFSLPAGDRGEVPLLYNRLGQNIDMEAGHYAGYIDYRENLRLRDFWKELDQLNLNREEIIQMIMLLESRMEGRIAGEAYPVPSGIARVTGPSRLSLFFSNWRPFYVLLTGGFFMIISSLLIFSYCPVCQQQVVAFRHVEERQRGVDTQRKAA